MRTKTPGGRRGLNLLEPLGPLDIQNHPNTYSGKVFGGDDFGGPMGALRPPDLQVLKNGVGRRSLPIDRCRDFLPNQ